MEKVSIIMPCYNDGKYIRESIDSVFKQSYPEIELIIIDDGSDDPETKKILCEIQDERITILNNNHQGPAFARNRGIMEATGKYILPVDSDDKIDPSYVEKAVNILEKNPQIGVVYCQANLFGEKTGKWNLPDYSFETMLVDNVVFITAMFLKSDWEKVGGFSTNMTYGMEDYDFWISILELGKEIYQIPEILFHYRIKPVSRTTQFKRNRDNVQDIYERIYLNHPAFYHKYADQYAILLRRTLINQIHMREDYENVVMELQQIFSVPVLGKIVKKVYDKRKTQ